MFWPLRIGINFSQWAHGVWSTEICPAGNFALTNVTRCAGMGADKHREWRWNEECKSRIQGVLCRQLKLCFLPSTSSQAHLSLFFSPLGPKSRTRAPRDSSPDFPYGLLPWPTFHHSTGLHQGLRAELQHQVTEAQGADLLRGGGDKRTAICPWWAPDLNSTLFFLQGSFGWLKLCFYN